MPLPKGDEYVQKPLFEDSPTLQIKSAQKTGRLAANVTTTSRPTPAQHAQDPARQPSTPAPSIQVDFGPPEQEHDPPQAPAQQTLPPEPTAQQPSQQEALSSQTRDPPNAHPGGNKPASQQQQNSGNAPQEAAAQRYLGSLQGVRPQGNEQTDDHNAAYSSEASAQQPPVGSMDRGQIQQLSSSTGPRSQEQAHHSFASQGIELHLPHCPWHVNVHSSRADPC